MRFPLHVTAGMIAHQIRNALRGRRRYPYVLMLEPLYACNLACLGCATERHTGRIEDRLSVEACLKAVDDAGAPMVSICGGEPTIYPELKEVIEGIIRKRRHIYLCTNALLLDTKVYGVIPPDPRLSINVHLDGLKATHDQVCDRSGTFEKAVAMIREGKRRGYRVITNTTVFKETDMGEVEALFDLLKEIGVDGMLISPGYSYESVDRDIFLTRREIHSKFRRLLAFAGRFRLQSSPMFLEFAAGLRDYRCSPWSTVTFTPRGWKGPCYLIGKQYFPTWEEYWTGVDWDYWESRQDRLCQNCAMHSGFEASAVAGLRSSLKDMARMAGWNLFG
jgi:hopanoid biosynthesis associated radical SAM protein HpnH